MQRLQALHLLKLTFLNNYTSRSSYANDTTNIFKITRHSNFFYNPNNITHQCYNYQNIYYIFYISYYILAYM